VPGDCEAGGMRDLNLKNESQRLLGRICVTLRAAARTGGRDQPREGCGQPVHVESAPHSLGSIGVDWLVLEIPFDSSASARAAFGKPS
jgi:hypothetical protein